MRTLRVANYYFFESQRLVLATVTGLSILRNKLSGKLFYSKLALLILFYSKLALLIFLISNHKIFSNFCQTPFSNTCVHESKTPTVKLCFFVCFIQKQASVPL